ncbi:hypothetical protein [Chishuiella sp.]|uniref:hypothetical protein n=1 Tax=Chishuiella sp. TaxID=1969467 RepID=UPI0028AD6453|nr:hypothetical protein [Chishuiella sp.]
MKLNEIQDYIKYWSIYLKENRVKGLTKILKNYDYFEFESNPSLGSDSEYLHAYIGISKDIKDIKIFIISDLHDCKERESDILKHISIASLKKETKKEMLKETIDDKRVKKRISRWKKNPYKYLQEEISEDYNLVRCFKIPTEDLLTTNHKAYFAIKKARTAKEKDYRLDLIIKNIEKNRSKQEDEISYDTIRLVPPFPPTTKTLFLLEHN